MHTAYCATICALLLSPCLAQATTVYRCEDRNGHTTYTLQGCPAEQEQYLEDVDNPTPGSGRPVPLAETGRTARAPAANPRKDEPIVVGEQQDGCGNRVTGSTRRTAMIKQRIRSGMTRADVESSLGTPDKISSHNGQMRYHYRDRRGNTRQVSFDEAGCVKGKR
ncbi:DUF4124 domain-containing protein [Pseudomonas zhanjiangensis]|uniref:DUF4124 domain-containing protein n=1 Tax=Pseudomonas zhanjiangensis TaxID=3239015 RepID=A0ABV3YUX8_9PSED